MRLCDVGDQRLNSEEDAAMRRKPKEAAKPMLDTCAEARFSLGGEMGRRLEAVTRQWILPAPYANPGMLEMFRHRDRKPSHDMVPWAGEFAGKYLTHAVQIWRICRHPCPLPAEIRFGVSGRRRISGPNAPLLGTAYRRRPRKAPLAARVIMRARPTVSCLPPTVGVSPGFRPHSHRGRESFRSGFSSPVPTSPLD